MRADPIGRRLRVLKRLHRTAAPRSNGYADLFGELCTKLGLLSDQEPRDELELTVRVLESLPGQIGADLREGAVPAPTFGIAPVQFVDVFPNTPNGKVNLFPEEYERAAPLGLYRFQPDPGTEAISADAHLTGQ
jgi:hypothetical protein